MIWDENGDGYPLQLVTSMWVPIYQYELTQQKVSVYKYGG